MTPFIIATMITHHLDTHEELVLADSQGGYLRGQWFTEPSPSDDEADLHGNEEEEDGEEPGTGGRLEE